MLGSCEGSFAPMVRANSALQHQRTKEKVARTLDRLDHPLKDEETCFHNSMMKKVLS